MARRIIFKKGGLTGEAPTGFKFLGLDNGSLGLKEGEDITFFDRVSIGSVEVTTFTLDLETSAKLLRVTNSSPITITIPTNSSVEFKVGTVITIEQAGDGQVEIDAANGVTLNFFEGTKTAGKHHGIQLVKVGTDEWTLFAGVE